jgi:2,4-dienoyl-CoA reductase-like NADH-dependent reductase (Old Yellow Enzyme family)
MDLPNDWHLVRLGTRAVGGAGLVFTEAIAVTPEGRISPNDLGLWLDDHIEPLKRITNFIKQQGVASGIQLAHAGRKASVSEPWNGDRLVIPNEGGWKTVAPSALAFSADKDLPEELNIEGIKTNCRCVQELLPNELWQRASAFWNCMAHMAISLMSSCLRLCNRRHRMNMAGSFQNRIRFLLEIIAAVRMEWPDTIYP